MRQVKEAGLWRSLRQERAGVDPRPLTAIGTVEVDLSVPCIVVGGRNGAGKSRLLRDLEASLEGKGLLVNLHQLCEQMLMVLSSRDDIDEMLEEFGSGGPSEERLDDIKRVVVRDYDAVEWFALEIEVDDERIANRFRWSEDPGDQVLIPYFRAEYRGHVFGPDEMGLGELSVHMMFWILEQYREQEDLVLLLDEPDAFLPPIGVSALLARLLKICRDRKWQMVITTHSEELIALAVEEEAFTLLRVDEAGSTVAIRSADEPHVARELLARPAIEQRFYCEDETAYYLTAALLEAADPITARATSIVWGKGEGFLRRLHQHLPRDPRPELRFGIVFDGDQRDSVEQKEDSWPALFLPRATDPDSLLRQVATDRPGLAARLGVSEDVLGVVLDGLEGKDPHDWVNDLAARFGREHTLSVLAAMWVEKNPDDLDEFVQQMVAGFD